MEPAHKACFGGSGAPAPLRRGARGRARGAGRGIRRRARNCAAGVAPERLGGCRGRARVRPCASCACRCRQGGRVPCRAASGPPAARCAEVFRVWLM